MTKKITATYYKLPAITETTPANHVLETLLFATESKSDEA